MWGQVHRSQNKWSCDRGRNSAIPPCPSNEKKIAVKTEIQTAEDDYGNLCLQNGSFCPVSGWSQMKYFVKNLGFVKAACLFLLVGLVPETVRGEDEIPGQPRTAPGTTITVPAEVDYDDTSNRAPLVEVLATLPDPPAELKDDVRFSKEVWARDVRFDRDIWCLQFSFKPVRIVYVDIPNKNGKFDKKPVWYWVYMVKNIGPAQIEKVVKERKIQVDGGERSFEEVQFNIKNPGGSIGTETEKPVEMPVAKDTTAVSEEAGTSVPQTRDAPLTLRNIPGTFIPRPGKDEPIQFVPQFVLAADKLVLGTESSNHPETGRSVSKSETAQIAYVDQQIPIALSAIMEREGMRTKPETTVSITQKQLKSGESAWGVAMWTDIDPRINKFSIYVTGLTNAYRWQDDEKGNTGKLGEGRMMERRILQTNWWRIGDKYTLNDSQIQYGQPGIPGFQWIYR